MTGPQLSAALRFVEMCLDPKKLAKASAAFKLAHKADLLTAFHEARRVLEASNKEAA